VKRIINFILKDITVARRDNIILYMLIAPLLIAFIMRLFIPSLESSTVAFAVDVSKGTEFAEKLKGYGKVYVMQDDAATRERVGKTDDVIGITATEGKYTVILEGNENDEIKEAAYVVLADITRGQRIAQYSINNTGGGKSLIKEYSAILIILMSVLIAGMSAGFNIIDEKESGAVRAISVTPLRMWQYLAARSIIITVFALILSLLSTLILLGTRVNLLYTAVGTLFCSGIAILLGILIGGFAENQIKGIAMVKLIAFPFTIIPVASIFIPQKWQALLYIFPNYWMFRIFFNIFVKVDISGFWLSAVITLAISAVFLLLLIFPLKKRLRFR
jgi:ABC-2 type transport system permease protein